MKISQAKGGVIYSFCERVWAGPSSPWHIRGLSPVGRKLGGGIDTPSLCGRIAPPEGKGWDLDIEITAHHLTHACKACVAEYERITRGSRGVTEGSDT